MGKIRKKGGKPKRKIFGQLVASFIIIFILLGIAAALLSGVVMVKGMKYFYTPEQAESLSGYDCILVLGAGLRKDGTPAGILAARLDLAIFLYKNGASGTLLLSGDRNEETGYSEPDAMRLYVLAAGVPEDAVTVDYEGFSTYESIVRAKEVFGMQRVLIVTQQYHLYRAMFTAEQTGLEGFGVIAELPAGSNNIFYHIREVAARAREALRAVLTAPPSAAEGF